MGRLAPATLVAIEPLADGWRARVRTGDGERSIDIGYRSRRLPATVACW